MYWINCLEIATVTFGITHAENTIDVTLLIKKYNLFLPVYWVKTEQLHYKPWRHITKNKLGAQKVLYGVAEWQDTNAHMDKSKTEAEAQLYCDGSVDFVQSSWRLSLRDKQRGTQETNRGAKTENNSWGKAHAALCFSTPWQAFPYMDTSKKNHVKLGSCN